MSKEFEIEDLQYNFDFKGLLLKLLGHWKLFVFCLGIAFAIAYYINIRKLPVYTMSNMISIKDDQNPFFTTNTSLTFNWGGTTDKVNTALIILRSRSHNEQVVDYLQYYTNYLRDGKYQRIDAYKLTPFNVQVDTARYQILNVPFTVTVLDTTTFRLSATFDQPSYTTQTYGKKTNRRWTADKTQFEGEFNFGEPIRLPFLNATLSYEKFRGKLNTPYYFSFSNYYQVINRYKQIRVFPESDGSSVLKMSLIGPNKARLVDYLNNSASILSANLLERKNLFATKTIAFIDSSLTTRSSELKEVEDELNDFKNKNSIYNLDQEGADLSNRLRTYDLAIEASERQLSYYNTLENYLLTKNDYNNVPAPTVAGIEEGSIAASVNRIIELAERRSRYKYSFKDNAPVFAEIDRDIDAVKQVLLENIASSKDRVRSDISNVESRIARSESAIRRLPKEQQELLKIERKYNLSLSTYNLFLSKKSEADLVKAANISDVLVIDSAKDTGGGRIGPNNSLNYILAAILGFFIPFLLVFVRFLLNNKIQHGQDIKRLSNIPVLGIIGKSNVEGNLAVLERPKSAIAESFRAVRSSLQFLYKEQGVSGAKTVLITSSVSGEGKTFCSINIASVFALSNKRTILLGLDLRKPKIFGDFDIKNDIGVVNCLIKDATLEEVVQRTSIPNLDIITSGPVPPNPSELLMNEQMDLLMETLKQEYDYIILDSPPLGLVTDAIQLVKYSDANLYVIRI